MRQHLFAFFDKRYLQCDALLRFVSGTPFTTSVAAIILLKAFFMGVTVQCEIDEAFTHGRSDCCHASEQLQIAEFAFTSVFARELAVRIAALEFGFFFADDWKLNCLDFVLVVSIIETVWAPPRK